MRDFRLDPDTHDLVIAGFDLAVTDGPESVVQNIKQRLLFFTGEWFLNLAEGTPWIEQILGQKRQRQGVVEDILKARIRGTPGVAELTAFALEAAGERAARVTFDATTSAGARISDNVEFGL
jgi:hypothetical protein